MGDKYRPQAVFNAWSCQNGKSGLSKAAGTIMCHVLRCKPTNASSAGPKSHLEDVRSFFEGAGCDSMPEALDDDEDESDELESETWSTMSSETSAMSAKGWRMDAWLNRKKFHSGQSLSFLNCSKTNDGSIIGIWPPRLRGVTGLHPFVICSISAV